MNPYSRPFISPNSRQSSQDFDALLRARRDEALQTQTAPSPQRYQVPPDASVIVLSDSEDDEPPLRQEPRRSATSAVRHPDYAYSWQQSYSQRSFPPTSTRSPLTPQARRQEERIPLGQGSPAPLRRTPAVPQPDYLTTSALLSSITRRGADTLARPEIQGRIGDDFRARLTGDASPSSSHRHRLIGDASPSNSHPLPLHISALQSRYHELSVPRERSVGERLSEMNPSPDQTPQSTANSPKNSPCEKCIWRQLECNRLDPCSQCRQRRTSCTYSEASVPAEQRPSKVITLSLYRAGPGTGATPPDSAQLVRGVGREMDATAPGDPGQTKSSASEYSAQFLLDNRIRSNEGDLSRRVERQAQQHLYLDGEVDEEPGSVTHASEPDHHHDHESDSAASSTYPVPRTPIQIDMGGVETRLAELSRELDAWQEVSVQADLRLATLDVRKAPGPKIDQTLPDPFQKLVDSRIQESGHVPPQPDVDDESRPQKKLMIIRTEEKPLNPQGKMLPKYKAIGRVASSFLAPNFRTAKYRPYDADDEVQDPDVTEKYAELEQRFNNNYDSLLAQRNCQERVWRWTPVAKELCSSLHIKLSDVLYFFTQDHFDPDRELACDWSVASSKAWREEQMRQCRTCELADPESRWTHFGETFDSLPRPDDRSLALAGLVANAFHEKSGVSLWHIAVGGLIQPRYEDPKAVTSNELGFCVVCFRHHCPDHGSYEEPSDEDRYAKDVEEYKAFINDQELEHNLRKFMTLPNLQRQKTESHTCGVFCVEPSQPLKQILGRQADGSVGGECRPTVQSRQVLGDDELCGPACFWDVTNRRDIKIEGLEFKPFLSQSEKILVDKLLHFYLNNKRGPCLITRIIKDVSCGAIFEYILYSIHRHPHALPDAGATSDSSAAHQHQNHIRRGKKPKVLPMIDASQSAELDERPPFMPCSHEGPCQNSNTCSCLKNKVHCERFCGCDKACKRHFRGCNCTLRGNKICFKDNRCECWKMNRECDPFLCGKCGVMEVLDSSNKYNDEIRQGRCKNNRIQLGIPAPTTKAPSQIQGYGLYSRAEILSGEFIGEYTGEVVSIQEGDRRGAMYHVLNQEYLFVINKGQEIDASNNGNKMRFMNNSRRDEHINVEPKKLWCNGVVRVGLYAKRDISAGEELLYNYNYPESVVKNFWEPGEKPANARSQIPVASERIARRTGKNKLAGENSSSQSPLPSRLPKRKRAVKESARILDQTPDEDGDATETSAEATPPAPEVADSEYSAYETNGHDSAEAELDGESSDEFDDELVQEPRTRGKRKTYQPRQLRQPQPQPQPQPRPRGRQAAQRVRQRATVAPRAAAREGGTQHDIAIRQTRSGNSSVEGRGGMSMRSRSNNGDKRYGGKAQRRAWMTRKLAESVSDDMLDA